MMSNISASPATQYLRHWESMLHKPGHRTYTGLYKVLRLTKDEVTRGHFVSSLRMAHWPHSEKCMMRFSRAVISAKAKGPRQSETDKTPSPSS